MRLTKLPYVAQQVGIVHFYAVAEIKGLPCRLRWMDEWRNLLTSTHVGHRLCHVGSHEWRGAESLKFGVQGATATNWFPRDNGARDSGIWLYHQTVVKSWIKQQLFIFPNSLTIHQTSTLHNTIYFNNTWTKIQLRSDPVNMQPDKTKCYPHRPIAMLWPAASKMLSTSSRSSPPNSGTLSLHMERNCRIRRGLQSIGMSH